MQQTSPPWRVFDATSPETAGSNRATESANPDPALLPLSLPPLVVAALAAAVVAGALAVAIAVGSPRGSVAGPGDPGGSASSAELEVVVEVAGAVVEPGLYRLPPGSRVGDALSAAGGFSPRVDAQRAGSILNLAAVLEDGERIVVPSRDDEPVGSGSSSGASGTGGSGGSGLIDLNTASQLELESLPGIGPVTAGKIVASRAQSPFGAVDELRERGLVGQATFEGIRDLVTVG